MDAPTKPAPNVPAKQDPKSPAAPPSLEESIKARMTSVSKRDFYKVGRAMNDHGQWEDVMAPSARILQKWSNDAEKPISTSIVRSGTTDQGCSVTVRGWIGDEAKPVVVKEETISMHWLHELEWLLTESIKNGITLEEKVGGQWQKQTVIPPFDMIEGTNGIHGVVLRDPKHQLHVLAQWYRTKRFGERVCTTKAEARIHRKLLSGEWRDEDEIQHEAEEMRDTASAQGVPPAEFVAGTSAGPLPTERLIPQGKAEPGGAELKAASAMAITSLLTRFRDLGDRFPLPEGEDHRKYLTYAVIGMMRERGTVVESAQIEEMTQADIGRLWTLLEKVSKGDEASLIAIDGLHGIGKKTDQSGPERTA